MESNLEKRIVSAVILAPLVLIIIYFGKIPYMAMILAAGILMLREWAHLTASSAHRAAWWLLGVIYIATPCYFLVWLREIPDIGLFVILLIISVVWATDIGAYLFGRLIGGPKLAPKISPGKTWAGAIGGLFCGVIISQYLIYMAGGDSYSGMLYGAIISFTGQLGDLFESFIKRKFGVKDSGNVIPGHGGMLDRLDSLLFAAPAAAAIYSFLYLQ